MAFDGFRWPSLRDLSSQLLTQVTWIGPCARAVQAQMLLPQQRWVQPTLAVAKTSALLANALWSHTDGAALSKMGKILEEDCLPMPKLSISATAKPRDSTDGTTEITAGLVPAGEPRALSASPHASPRSSTRFSTHLHTHLHGISTLLHASHGTSLASLAATPRVSTRLHASPGSSSPGGLRDHISQRAHTSHPVASPAHSAPSSPPPLLAAHCVQGGAHA